jgi:hypothetical protein
MAISSDTHARQLTSELTQDGGGVQLDITFIWVELYVSAPPENELERFHPTDHHTKQ